LNVTAAEEDGVVRLESLIPVRRHHTTVRLIVVRTAKSKLFT
jgi:hypothetical protein